MPTCSLDFWIRDFCHDVKSRSMKKDPHLLSNQRQQRTESIHDKLKQSCHDIEDSLHTHHLHVAVSVLSTVDSARSCIPDQSPVEGRHKNMPARDHPMAAFVPAERPDARHRAGRYESEPQR